jgi:hypothetical protein
MCGLNGLETPGAKAGHEEAHRKEQLAGSAPQTARLAARMAVRELREKKKNGQVLTKKKR